MHTIAIKTATGLFLAAFALSGCGGTAPAALDAKAISEAADAMATISGDVVRIGWSRNDVKVNVDGKPFPPPAGLGSWAAFKPAGAAGEAMVMGDTVVFQDEVDAAMDAAFANGIEITALHNHFFYDDPKVYFMHIGGRGSASDLAKGVKAMWDAIKKIRSVNKQPSDSFGDAGPDEDDVIDAKLIRTITGLDVLPKPGGVLKISKGRSARMHGTEIGGSMGLGSWAAFRGSNESAVMDGDFIMAADEVQSVLKTLRRNGIHVVALHNHMIGEEPAYYFTHFWGKGTAKALAEGFKAALDAQK